MSLIAGDGAAQEDAALRKAADDVEKYRKGDARIRVLDAAGRPVPGAAVTVELTRHSFLFGCNIYMFDRFKTAPENEAYKQRFAELLNYATTGFYWTSYEPEKGKPNYPYTDKVVAWCAAHGIRVKGHPLLWGYPDAGVPKWSQGQPEPAVQEQRVRDILARYRGKIEFWEVVNEPAHAQSVKVDPAYRWARAADPKGCLIINDYFILADGQPEFFKLLQDALAADVPFDGIGIQAHEPRTMRFPLERVQSTLDHYATLRKDLHITEFTPTSSGEPIVGSHVVGNWDEAAQADYAEKFYRVCFAHPAVVALTWWDLCDNGSWLKGGGLLRADLSPKPAYTALRKLLHEEWHTRAQGQTDAAGTFALHGFYGRYTAKVTSSRGGVQKEFELQHGTENAIEVRLQQ